MALEWTESDYEEQMRTGYLDWEEGGWRYRVQYRLDNTMMGYSVTRVLVRPADPDNVPVLGFRTKDLKPLRTWWVGNRISKQDPRLGIRDINELKRATLRMMQGEG